MVRFDLFHLITEDRELVIAVYPECMCLSCVVSGDILYSPPWPMFCRRKSGEAAAAEGPGVTGATTQEAEEGRKLGC